MLEYKNILVPHAGTKTGDIALEKAINIAKECDGKITILSVVEPVSIPLDLISDSEQNQMISELQYGVTIIQLQKRPLWSGTFVVVDLLKVQLPFYKPIGTKVLI